MQRRILWTMCGWAKEYHSLLSCCTNPTFRGQAKWFSSQDTEGCGDGVNSYIQGQSPEPKIREYFYYIDHQGQLFMDDARIKNFTSCFKDKEFLIFFFKRLKLNHTSRYKDRFPWLSLCGRERNFIRCDDLPVVYTHILFSSDNQPQTFDYAQEKLEFCHGGVTLSVNFDPSQLYMCPNNGRVYYPAPERHGSVGLVSSAIAEQLSKDFVFKDKTDHHTHSPTHIMRHGTKHILSNNLASTLEKMNWHHNRNKET